VFLTGNEEYLAQRIGFATATSTPTATPKVRQSERRERHEKDSWRWISAALSRKKVRERLARVDGSVAAATCAREWLRRLVLRDVSLGAGEHARPSPFFPADHVSTNALRDENIRSIVVATYRKSSTHSPNSDKTGPDQKRPFDIVRHLKPRLTACQRHLAQVRLKC